MDPDIIFEEGDPEDADHVETENNHDHTTDFSEPGPYIIEKAPERCSSDIEEDKDHAETDDERDPMR